MHKIPSRIPRYNDDADYTTNAPSYYEDLARKGKLIQVLAERIGFYDEELAKRFAEWDKQLEELPDTLKELFLKWVDDGTLAKILAQLLLDDYATFVWVKEYLEDYATNESVKELYDQLSKIIDGVEINVVGEGLSGDGKTNNFVLLKELMKKVSDSGGGILKFPNGTYVIDSGEDFLEIHDNITWKLDTGTTLDITNTIIRGYSKKRGYDGGVKNFSIIGGRLKGDFEKLTCGDVRASKFLIHHGKNLQFINTIFEQIAYGHVFDLCGCDNVVFNGCQFIGRLLPESGSDYKECIQIDHSSVAGLGFNDEYDTVDGLPTRNVEVSNCKFIPYKINNNIVYPAPTPMGNHSQFPKAPYNIIFRDNYMESVNHISESDWTEKFSGWVHFSTVQNLIVSGNTFNNIEGNRGSALTIRDRAMHFTDEPFPASTDYDQIRDITFKDNIVKGFNHFSQPGMRGLVSIVGWYGYKKIENIIIQGNQFIDCGKKEKWSNDKRPLDCIELGQVSNALVKDNYFSVVDRVLYVRGSDDQTWKGETNITFKDNDIDFVSYATCYFSYTTGNIIMTNNTFFNISGAIRLSTTPNTKAIFKGNVIKTNDDYHLKDVEGVSETFFDTIFSLRDDENVKYYLLDNIALCDKKVWEYMFKFTNQNTMQVVESGNIYETMNKDNIK